MPVGPARTSQGLARTASAPTRIARAWKRATPRLGNPRVARAVRNRKSPVVPVPGRHRLPAPALPPGGSRWRFPRCRCLGARRGLAEAAAAAGRLRPGSFRSWRRWGRPWGPRSLPRPTITPGLKKHIGGSRNYIAMLPPLGRRASCRRRRPTRPLSRGLRLPLLPRTTRPRERRAGRRRSLARVRPTRAAPVTVSGEEVRSAHLQTAILLGKVVTASTGLALAAASWSLFLLEFSSRLPRVKAAAAAAAAVARPEEERRTTTERRGG